MQPPSAAFPKVSAIPHFHQRTDVAVSEYHDSSEDLNFDSLDSLMSLFLLVVCENDVLVRWKAGTLKFPRPRGI